MKLITLIPALMLVFSLVSCNDEKNEVPERLNLLSICTTYSSDKVESTYNGMDFSLSGEVTLAMESPATYNASKADARMILTIPSPWPEFYGSYSTIQVPIDATSYQDYMTYTGTYMYSKAKIEVSGFCRNGILSVDMDYSDEYESWVKIGKTYEFELSPEALNLKNIYTNGLTVTWKGENYDGEDFVRMALSPVLNRIAENIGGNILTMTVSKDSKLSLGSRTETGGTIKPITGTFLMKGQLVACDAQGAESVNKLFFACEDKEPLYRIGATPTHFFSLLMTGLYPDMNQASFTVISEQNGSSFMAGGGLQHWENQFRSEGDNETADLLQTLRLLNLTDAVLLFGNLKE